jgi:hypothetical protein
MRHLPLDVQLENGVRSLEIDIHNTPNGWEVMHVPHLIKKPLALISRNVWVQFANGQIKILNMCL